MLLLAGWFLLVLGYALYVDAGFISRDQWRFLDMLDHYLSGKLDWRELWQSHSEHVKPGYKLLFLWNARYLGLNLLLEVVVGILLLGAATLVTGRELLASFDDAGSRGAALALLAAGAVLMSFNQWANYTYSLLALGGFAGTLVQLGFFAGWSRLLNRGLSPAGLVGLAALLALGILGFSGARSPAVLGAAIITALLAAVLDPALRKRLLTQGLPLLLTGLAGIGLYLSLLDSGRTSEANLSNDLMTLLQEPLGGLGYVSGLLAQSMLNLTAMGKLTGITPVVLLALLGYALLAWALWRYFAARHWQRSWMPLLLILYSGLFTLEVLVGRYATDHSALEGSGVPRYVFDAHLWMAGVAWIAGLEWARTPKQRRFAAAALALILALELANLYFGLRTARFFARSSVKTVAVLQEMAAGKADASMLPPWECPSDAVCTQGMEILKKYRLNVARDAAP